MVLLLPLTIIFLYAALVWASITYIDFPLSLYMRGLDADQHAVLKYLGFFEYAGRGEYYYPPLVALTLFACYATFYQTQGGKALMPWLSDARLFLYRIGYVLTALAISGALLPLAKGLCGRTRPVMWVREHLNDFFPFHFGMADYNSFPSGHTNTAFSFAIALAFVWPRLCVPFFLLAILVAAQRVVFTAHYLGDILGAIGFSYVMCWLVYKGYGLVLGKKVS